MLSFHQMLLNLTHRAFNSRVHGGRGSIFRLALRCTVTIRSIFLSDSLLNKDRCCSADKHNPQSATLIFPWPLVMRVEFHKCSQTAQWREENTKEKKKRLKILIRNWGPFFASSLTWNANTLPIKKVAPEKREGGRERERKSKWNLIFRGRGNVQAWQQRVGSCLYLTLAVSKTMSSHWAFYEVTEPRTCSQNMTVDTKCRGLFVGKHCKGSEWRKLKRLV